MQNYEKKLTQKLKDRIEQLKKEGKADSAAVITSSIEVVGDVMDHIDEMLGIEKKAKISIEFDCYSCKYKRMVEDMGDSEEISAKDDKIPNECRKIYQ